MTERPPLPHYDPSYCFKVAKWAARICVGWLAIELFILIAVDPSNGSCPGWAIYHKESGTASSLWVLAGFLTAAPTIWICYVVLRWEKKFSRDFYDAIVKYPDFVLFLNANRLFLDVNIGWCLFCTFPLWIMIAHCTSLPRYLEYLS